MQGPPTEQRRWRVLREGVRVANLTRRLVLRVRKRVAIEGSERGLDARVLRNDEDGRLGERAAGCNGSHWREGS
ncbi:hypothetical protein AHAS_Ahas18G0175500 [Arachis hypogaea]